MRLTEILQLHPLFEGVPSRGVNLVQNVGGRPVQGVWGDTSPPVGSRGEAPVGGLGDEVPAEAETILDFYMHNLT